MTKTWHHKDTVFFPFPLEMMDVYKGMTLKFFVFLDYKTETANKFFS